MDKPGTVTINQFRDVSCIHTYAEHFSALLKALLSLVLTVLLRFGNSCVHTRIQTLQVEDCVMWAA